MSHRDQFRTRVCTNTGERRGDRRSGRRGRGERLLRRIRPWRARGSGRAQRGNNAGCAGGGQAARKIRAAPSHTHPPADRRRLSGEGATVRGTCCSLPAARSGAARRRRSRRRLAPCGVRVRARHGREPVGQRVREGGVGSSDLRAVQADPGTPAYGTDLGARHERPPPARPTGPPPCAHDLHPAAPSVRDKTRFLALKAIPARSLPRAPTHPRRPRPRPGIRVGLPPPPADRARRRAASD